MLQLAAGLLLVRFIANYLEVQSRDTKIRSSSASARQDFNKPPAYHPTGAYEGFEVDWFRLETRVRQMLSDHMGPIVESIHGNGTNINENKLLLDSIRKKVDDTVFKVSIDQSKIKLLEEAMRKIFDFEGELLLLESRIK